MEMERLGLPPVAFPLILRLLRHDDVSQEHLADHLRVDKGTAARAVARLEEAGLIQRSVDEEDRRIKRVRVTEKGREMAPQIRDAAGRWSELLLDGFSAEEAADALSFLERMADNARRHWQDVDTSGCAPEQDR